MTRSNMTRSNMTRPNMTRSSMTAALIAACVAAACFTSSIARADRHREGRVLSDLYCRSEYDEALRNIAQLRGPERHAAREAAHRRYLECHKKAKVAVQIEDVRPRLFPR